ncbi:MAG TPA: AAA domain-containing protein [Kofleriaceae bacterium]|nr:AAA domain-containing protein [Kofleriaceae bacterium]
MAVADFLEALAAQWRAERGAAREKFAAARRGTSLRARVARGLALADLTVSEWRPAARERTRVLLSPPGHVDLDDSGIGPGDPVVLWRQSPDDPRATRGVVSARERHDLWVVIEGDLPEGVLEGGCNIDALAPESTFDRGDRAIERARTAKATSALARVVGILCGEREAAFAPAPTWAPIDRDLDEAQRAAVTSALSAHDVALIHGPPGTGKTRTLVEVVRQMVARGERVLCTAASNVAVDNLGERLAAAGVGVVRLGHPARVSAALEERTLDALVAASDGARLARDLTDRARELRRGLGDLRGDEARQLRQEIMGLLRDARASLTQAEKYFLDTTPVVLATCAGADARSLADRRFATVVIDEATQAPDPLALVAMARGERVILAGDPHQLPPTVVDVAAARAGLATTFFERYAANHPPSLLVTQHRMHADIMRFPSERTYGGALVAAPEVAGHTLADLGARPDPERGLAVWFVDTAGKDWSDRKGGTDEDDEVADPSTWNPEQAERVAKEVRRVLARGVPAADVAVIAAYDAQVRRLRALLAPERALGLEIRSVDGFQGREKEAVIVDTVRSNADGDIGFLADIRRMNVAITRARRWLLVVGDSATLGGHPYYAALISAMDDLAAHGSAWADDGDPL